jgi:hypothetical protein
MLGDIITKHVTLVTKKWAKQRKAEERNSQRAASRHDALRKASSRKMNIKEAAWEVGEGVS